MKVLASTKPRRFSFRHPLYHKLSNKPSWFLGKTASAKPQKLLRPPNQEGFHSDVLYATSSQINLLGFWKIF
jgi:hypothetical protein